MKRARVNQDSFVLSNDCYTPRMSQADVAKILALSVEERLRLIELIWESLSANAADIPISDEHRKIVEERMAEHERDPDDVITHEEMLAIVRRRR